MAREKIKEYPDLSKGYKLPQKLEGIMFPHLQLSYALWLFN